MWDNLLNTWEFILNGIMEFQRSKKGQRGFSTKYVALGKTTQTRVPITIKNEIKDIVDTLELLARDHNLQEIHDVLNTFNRNLKSHLKTD